MGSPREDSGLAVDVGGIVKTFGSLTAVNGVGLQVRRGEIYGFLGPNGSGKTTFLRMLCGLLKPDAGEGFCLGCDILREQAELKTKVGYMTQKFSLYEDLTARENLDFICRVYGVPDRRRRIDERLERLQFGDRAAQLAGTLSGGWRQRLALAACMMHSPELLLLDEPTAGVDPKARRDFWDEISRLSGEEGVTALITTHYMDEAERCHRLAYLSYGSLLARGTPREIVRDSGLHTWRVEGDGLMLHALSEELRQLPPVLQTAAFGNVLHASGTDEAGLRDALGSFMFARKEFRWEKADSGLEDVFMFLMGRGKDGGRG